MKLRDFDYLAKVIASVTYGEGVKAKIPDQIAA